MTLLQNPEHLWERPDSVEAIEYSELESRVGVITGPVELLTGGLANLNVRMGAGRVLRIYRREPRTAALEAALLVHPWQTFRTPAVLARGEDFLVLEHVSHGAMTDDLAGGEAVGAALAEIHTIGFSQPGALSPALEIRSSYPDFLGFLGDYIVSQIEHMPLEISARIGPGIEAFLAAHHASLRQLARTNTLLHGDFKAANLHWTNNGDLLVLDWEFAYSGPSLLDIGQLIRWGPSRSFLDAFDGSYRDHGGSLPEDWPRWAAAFDLVNLCGLLAGAAPESRRATDVLDRIHQTLAAYA